MNYSSIPQFIDDQSGIETIEFIGLLGVIAVLIAVIISIFIKMKNNVNDSAEQLTRAVESISSLK